MARCAGWRCALVAHRLCTLTRIIIMALRMPAPCVWGVLEAAALQRTCCSLVMSTSWSATAFFSVASVFWWVSWSTSSLLCSREGQGSAVAVGTYGYCMHGRMVSALNKCSALRLICMLVCLQQSQDAEHVLLLLITSCTAADPLLDADQHSVPAESEPPAAPHTAAAAP